MTELVVVRIFQFLFGNGAVYLNNVQLIINYWSLSSGQFTFGWHAKMLIWEEYNETNNIMLFPILLQLIYTTCNTFGRHAKSQAER